MRLDLNKYSINRGFIQNQYRTGIEKDIEKVISIVGCAIHCPLIALAFYMAEQEGFTPPLVKMIDSLISFYGYTEILGQKEGSPYSTKYGSNDIKR